MADRRVSVVVTGNADGAIRSFEMVGAAAEEAATAATEAGDRVAAAAVRQADTAAQAATRAAATAGAEADAAAQAFADGSEAAYARASAAAEKAALTAQRAWERADAAAVRAAVEASAQEGTAAEDVAARAAEAARMSARVAEESWAQAAEAAKGAAVLSEESASKMGLGDAFAKASAGASTLTGKIAEMTSSVPILGSTFKSMAEKMAEADTSGAKFGTALAGIGKVATVVGVAGLAVISVESVKMATSFQKSMEMLHTNANVAQSAIKGLSQGVLALAGPTATSPDQLSTALYHLASNGLRGKDALNALKLAAEGAKNGNANLEDTTNALGAVIAAKMVPGVRDYSAAMGDLNATVGAGDMKMQDLADAMGTGLLAAVKGFGVNLTDVGAALATFGDNNIRGAKAGTELRMAVQALAAPIKGGKAALEGMGLSMTQLGVDMQHGGLKQAINDLATHMKAAGDTGARTGEVLTEAFGKKAGIGINVLVQQIDRFNGKFAAVDAGSKNFGKDFAATSKTFAFQLDSLIATVQALGIKFGSWLIPKLQEAASVVASVTVWFEKHRTAAIALAAVIGGALVAAMTAFTISLFTADGALAFLIGPIGLVVLAVGALVAAGIWLSENWKQVWSDVKQWASDAWQFLDGIWHSVDSDIRSIWGGIEGFFRAWWPTILGVFTGGLGLIVGELIQHWAAITATIHQVWSDALGFFVSVWQSIASTVSAGVNSVVSFVASLPGRVMGAVSSLIGDLLSFGNQSMGSMLSGVVSGAARVFSFFAGLPGRILSAVGNLGGLLIRAGADLIGGLVKGIIGAVGSAVSAVSSAVGSVISGAKSILGIKSPSTVFAEIGKNTMLGLAQGITGSRSMPVAAVSVTGTAMIGAGRAGIGAGGVGAAVNYNPTYVLNIPDGVSPITKKYVADALNQHDVTFIQTMRGM